MALLNVSQYPTAGAVVSGQRIPTRGIDANAQDVTPDASSAALALTSNTVEVRLSPDTTVRVKAGDSTVTVSATTGERIPADAVVYCNVSGATHLAYILE